MNPMVIVFFPVKKKTFFFSEFLKFPGKIKIPLN